MAILFGLIALLLFGLGLKKSQRFFFKDYQGNQKERFKDNFVSSLCLSAGVGSLMIVVSSISTSKSVLPLLPCALGMSIIILPIGILGSYWQSYSTNKLFGGVMPLVRQRYGFAPTDQDKPPIGRSTLKLSQKTMALAAIAGVLSFCAIYVGMSLLMRWNGSQPAWLLFRLGLGALGGFSVFMLVLATNLSRNIQRERENQERHKQ
jgi:hypothetical protein